ncbi:DUF1501 domain-containing protein [bacterium]|jgi:hypothetical protein|nr:DUF1501 domain-containing protein [bacterium]
MSAPIDLEARILNQQSLRRRAFLNQVGGGLGLVALNSLFRQDGLVNAGPSTVSVDPLAPKLPHFAARAKRCIFLMMDGGVSQMDTFDPKPKLASMAGKVFTRNEKLKSNQNGGTRYFTASPFKFKKHGQMGMPVSDLFPSFARHVDDVAFLRSGYAESDNHPAALFHYLTGNPFQGSPSVGSWVVYGLGTENQNLPSFVVLRDGRPFGGAATWSNAYLPACYQGTQFRSGDHPVLNLNPPKGVSRERQRKALDLLGNLNEGHRQTSPYHPDLEARIANYELAFRMQMEVPDAVDVSRESERTKQLYGMDQDKTKTFGKRCLLARRLVERGVRFVQVWSGGWDSHDDIKNGHQKAAEQVDVPLAGLLQDLKDRGLLEDTLVVWGGEFGRTPDTNEGNFKKKKEGRDHNPTAMTMWFAGAGVQNGQVIGSTDELGHKAVEKPYHLRDIHATFLHLFGLDQSKLNFYHGGRFKQLTDTGGVVIRDLLAS